MGTYLQHMREMQRADDLQAAAVELAAKLKAGETVRVGSRRVIGPADVAEHSYDNDVSTDDACERIALHFVEQWVHFQWVNS